MSDENPPKLRLRPKLAGTPPPVTPTGSAPPAAPPLAVEATASSEVAPPKPAILRPKISLKPEAASPAAAPPGGVVAKFPQGENLAAPKSGADFPPPPVLKQKLGLAPKVENPLPTEIPAVFPPPLEDAVTMPAVLNAPPPPFAPVNEPSIQTWPPVLDAPPPPGLEPAATKMAGEAEAVPEEITAMRKASTFPFPAPTAKFPPLPGLSTGGDSAPPTMEAAEGALKKVLLMGGLVVLLLAGGGVWAYFKFLAKPAEAPLPSAAAPQTTAGKAAEKIKAAVQRAEDATTAPVNEVLVAEQPVTKPNTSTESSPADAAVPTAPQPPPEPVKPPPPPPASAAFKAWVSNLKIRGVRGGDNQRVFIDRTSYSPGELVNPDLAITFVGFDDQTRMIIFRDKRGSTVERRH